MAKKKVFRSFEKIAYSDWLGSDHMHDEGFECCECGEAIEYPKRKCPDCGTTYRYERASLELIRPVVVKGRTKEPIRILPFEINKPERVEKEGYWWKLWLRKEN